MSYGVAQFLQLTCARNLTRANWVSQMLTNGTLPIPFTATVLVQLAYMKNNPTALTTVDIGAMVVGAMVINNMTAVMLAVDQLTEPEFFTSEGFDVSTQPKVAEIVSKWVLDGPGVWRTMVKHVGLSTLEVGDSKMSVSLQKIRGNAKDGTEAGTGQHEKVQKAKGA